MVINHETVKEVERHLRWHEADIKNAAAITEEIATARGETCGGGKYNRGDPTIAAVMRCEKRLKSIKSWIKVVRLTRGHFDHDPRGELLFRIYTKRQPRRVIMAEMFLTESTYTRMKGEIIVYAAMKACEEKVLRV